MKDLTPIPTPGTVHTLSILGRVVTVSTTSPVTTERAIELFLDGLTSLSESPAAFAAYNDGEDGLYIDAVA